MTHERLTHEVHRRSLPGIYNVLTNPALVICSRLSITAAARRNVSVWPGPMDGVTRECDDGLFVAKTPHR